MIRAFCFLLTLLTFSSMAQETGNTIRKSNFNFGHQLGYLYSRMDDAYFHTRGEWSFETGALAYYTEKMPLVRNPKWQERLMVTVPLYFEFSPSDNILLQADITDLFVEFPYQDIHNMGGKSPRFRTKIKVLEESRRRPAVAFTLGIKFSSAKPFTIWDNNHNYDESNGLAGADTGVADYLLLFLFSKHLEDDWLLHGRIGLLPIGSPVEYTRGSGQADEIPYGLSLEHVLSKAWSFKTEVAGMKNGLSSTQLAHYSVARVNLIRSFTRLSLNLNLEHGLTRESDEWVAGVYTKFGFGKIAR
ncbi:MAG: hypothetical protein A2293_13290 [Elusimicrobia bacterium RIFOXYB2_FULL_49_7]|nr:MAG: hypothetical protein A2293_13290 [Elusimicrobia bacterium RIFOXYB2_FULL_49_7]